MNQDTEAKEGNRTKLILLVIVFCVTVAGIFVFKDSLSLESLSQRETQLREIQASWPVLVFGAAFGIYALATGFSIPGAAALTLVYGWYFGFWPTLVLVSFASTTGATMAFLMSRYFVSDWVQQRFGDRLKAFNQQLETDGVFYLFTLRLIPAVPFFVINLVMGLTPIRVRDYWWVSQIGMLPGTAVYVYAGSRVPNLSVLADEGIASVISPGQLGQLTFAFALLGVFPLIVRFIMSRLGKPQHGE